MKCCQLIIIMLALVVTQATAQKSSDKSVAHFHEDSVTNFQNSSNEEIFKDILQSLSPALRNKLDSTKEQMKAQASQNAPMNRNRYDNSRISSDRAIEMENERGSFKDSLFTKFQIRDSIPDVLKERIEKTIREMENKDRGNRSVEFKDGMNGRSQHNKK